MTTPMQDRVSPETFERLRSMVAPYGWTPMLTERDGAYRAWMRKDGDRMFGTWSPTPDEAAAALISKVSRWVRL